MIIKNNASLWAFGDSSKRALSVQQKIDQVDIPTVAAVPQNTTGFLGQVTMVASGDEHSACVTDKGRVLVVGSNQHQRLGLAGKTILDTQVKFTPVDLLGPKRIAQVACSFFHTMALTEDGELYTWGGTLGGKRGGKEIRSASLKFEPLLIAFF